MERKFKNFSTFIIALVFILSISVTAFGKTFEPKEVDANKTWVIKFNEKIDSNNINENINVENYKGNIIKTKLEVIENTVSIKPPKGGYEPGEYTIKISDKIKSTTGEKIKKGYKVNFGVTKSIGKNDIQEVNNCDELLEVVKKKVKEFKIVDEHVQQVYDKAKIIIDNVTDPNMTELEKERALHDYIVKNTAYDYDNYLNGTIPAESYSPYGILIKNAGVCQGYAETMSLLLNMADIECKVVSGKTNGGGHAWNKVKINGKEYNLDATWDDPVPDNGPNYVRYDYFNISDDQLSQNHNWDIVVNKDGNEHTFNYKYYKFCKDNNVKIGTTRKIKGRIIIPDGENAVNLSVRLRSDSGTPTKSYDDIEYVEDIEIPKGQHYVDFAKDVLLNKTGYTVSYFLYFIKDKENHNYGEYGFYTEDGKTKKVINLSGINEKYIEIKLKKPVSLIKGTISLANGKKAPNGGIEVSIEAVSCAYLPGKNYNVKCPIASQNLKIPEGENSINYVLPIPANKYGYYIDYFAYNEGYYYKKDGINITKLYANQESNKANIILYENKD